MDEIDPGGSRFRRIAAALTSASAEVETLKRRAVAIQEEAGALAARASTLAAELSADRQEAPVPLAQASGNRPTDRERILGALDPKLTELLAFDAVQFQQDAVGTKQLLGTFAKELDDAPATVEVALRNSDLKADVKARVGVQLKEPLIGLRRAETRLRAERTVQEALGILARSPIERHRNVSSLSAPQGLSPLEERVKYATQVVLGLGKAKVPTAEKRNLELLFHALRVPDRTVQAIFTGLTRAGSPESSSIG
jgi:hypothetical protein